jgi:SAM-dependent methyltransferase
MTRLLKKILFFVPNLIIDLSIFELRSFIGRLITGRMKVDPNATNYLNLGCGQIIQKGMINLDFFFNPNLDYAADLRFPLKIESDSMDGIICEHTMEHLTYEQDDRLLAECYRIMKPGGTMRIILPDVSLFVKNYAEGNQAWFDKWEQIMFKESKDPVRSKRRLATPLSALSFVTQEYGHISAWDVPTLKFYMEKAGFKDVQQVAFKQGRDENLLIDTDVPGRLYVSLYVEGIK